MKEVPKKKCTIAITKVCLSNYRLRGETRYEETPAETNEDFIILGGLRPGEVYEVKVVAVDGEFTSESHSEDVETFSVGQ